MFSRRALLKFAGLSLTAMPLLAKEKSKKSNAFYLQVNMFGAPSRWLFDLPLFPYEKKGTTNRNMMVGNNISSIEKFESQLLATSLNGVNYPSVWNKSVVSSEGIGKLNNLYENMLTIRGCNMAIDGHETNSQKLMSPFRLGNSINAQIAKYYPTDFGPLQLLQDYSPLVTTPGAYQSVEGISPVNIFTIDNYSKKLFNYDFKKSKISFENKLLNALAELNGLNKVNEKIFEKKLGQFKYQFDRAKIKYEKVLNENFKKYLDEEKKKIPLVSRFKSETGLDEEKLKKKKGHLFYDGLFLEGDNLREIVFNLEFPKLIEKFALTEVIALNGLSSSCLMMLDPPKNISFTGFDPVKNKSRIKKSVKGTFDTHNIGAVGDILIGNCFYFIFSSMLNEFVISLKKEDKFKTSLIHITSEFDRTPRNDLAGSDHGYQGHTSTLIGGQFKGTACIGNVYKVYNEPSALHKDNGIWGAGAPVKELDHRTISYRNISSTICYLLKIKSITPKDKSLISLGKNGELISLIGKAKNV